MTIYSHSMSSNINLSTARKICTEDLHPRISRERKNGSLNLPRIPATISLPHIKNVPVVAWTKGYAANIPDHPLKLGPHFTQSSGLSTARPEPRREWLRVRRSRRAHHT